MRGKKGTPHPDVAGPPRRRANKARGHGTWGNDRPLVLGVVGRQSGQLHLHVAHHSTRAALEPPVLACAQPGTTVHIDERGAYNHLSENQRGHATTMAMGFARCTATRTRVCGRACETSCGRFVGSIEVYLQQYAAMYAWTYRIKTVTIEFLRALLGVLTPEPT